VLSGNKRQRSVVLEVFRSRKRRGENLNGLFKAFQAYRKKKLQSVHSRKLEGLEQNDHGGRTQSLASCWS